jgi:chromosome segregation ATPase
VDRPERREAGGRVRLGRNSPEGRGGQEGPAKNDDAQDQGLAEEVAAEEVPAAELEETGRDEEVADPDEFRRRLAAKDQHIRELYDELAAARLTIDEVRAQAEAGEVRVRDLEEERMRLKGRLRALEEEERRQRRWRDGQDRRVARLEREIERREEEIWRLKELLESKEKEIEAHGQEIRSKDTTVENTLRRVEGLERDLEERENEAAELRATIDELHAELDVEYERRRRMAEPENRLRAGIDLFNGSEHLQSVGSISKSLGQPEVHVALGEGEEPPVILTFTWDDITWRAYVSNPGLAVEEPRVYQVGTGEGRSSVDLEPSNARIGPGGRVLLGL